MLCLPQGSLSRLSHRRSRMPSPRATSRGRTASRQVSVRSGIRPRCLATPACGETCNQETESRCVCTHGGCTMGQGHVMCVAWSQICDKSSMCSFLSFIMKTMANEDGSGGHSHAGAVCLKPLRLWRPPASGTTNRVQARECQIRLPPSSSIVTRAGNSTSVLRQRQFS